MRKCRRSKRDAYTHPRRVGCTVLTLDGEPTTAACMALLFNPAYPRQYPPFLLISNNTEILLSSCIIRFDSFSAKVRQTDKECHAGRIARLEFDFKGLIIL